METATLAPTTTDASQSVAVPLDTGISQETCDACGPGTLAAYTVLLNSGAGVPAELTLCGHHTRKYGFVPGLTDGKPASSDDARGYL